MEKPQSTLRNCQEATQKSSDIQIIDEPTGQPLGRDIKWTDLVSLPASDDLKTVDEMENEVLELKNHLFSLKSRSIPQSKITEEKTKSKRRERRRLPGVEEMENFINFEIEEQHSNAISPVTPHISQPLTMPEMSRERKPELLTYLKAFPIF